VTRSDLGMTGRITSLDRLGMIVCSPAANSLICLLIIMTVDYNVTIPDTLPSTCSKAGNCVIQWYWYASGNEQTYESCHDFYVQLYIYVN
jgi:hypothetical protein